MSDYIKREAALRSPRAYAVSFAYDRSIKAVADSIAIDIENIPAAPIDALVKAARVWAKADAEFWRASDYYCNYSNARHRAAYDARRDALEALKRAATALAALEAGDSK